MPKPVVQAQLYEGFFIHGVGELPKTLPPQNKTLSNFAMTLQDNGALFVEWDEGAYRKSFTLGAASVKVATHPATPKVKEAEAIASVTKIKANG
jgi:hypothetical protein